MDLKYDLHLSAYKISNESIAEFEKIGFKRDEFANNTRCEVTQYHGTYRGNELLPNDDLWEKLCQILDNDPKFSGGLEEESYNPNETITFEGKGILGFDDEDYLPSMETQQPPPNVNKACDIHISINLEESNLDSLKYLEVLKVASFDKPRDEKIYRIFTITCETFEDGKVAFDIVKNYLQSIRGLCGKVKLERTTRFFRKPATAYTLPLTDKIAFQKWLKELEKVHVCHA
jgi:hypothetical protein